MRALLAFLLCIVFLHAETRCFAADNEIAANGGPNYGSAGNFVGTYTGVLIATAESDSSETQTVTTHTDPVTGVETTNTIVTNNPATTVTPNALGLFSLGIVDTGLSSGVFLMFAAGQAFTGHIVGTVIPQQQQFDGVLGASFTPDNQSFSVLDSSGSTAATVTSSGVAQATASGLVSAIIGQTTTGLSTASASFIGSATLTVVGNINPFQNTFSNFGVSGSQSVTLINDAFTFSVEGTQQSSVVNVGTVPTLF